MTDVTAHSFDSIFDEAARNHEENISQGGVGSHEFTENAVARRFARKMSGALAYDHSQAKWYLWSGSIWVEDQVAASMERVRCFVEADRNIAVDPRDRAAMAQIRFANAVEHASRSDPLLAVHQGIWDCDPFLLGTPGGVVDLRTGQLRPGRPEDKITRQTSVVPAPPHTPAPYWAAFLEDATQGDCSLRDFLHRWVGYCLTGDVSEEVLAFIYGDGGNGKGVFVGTVAAVMGTYAVSQPMEAFTVNGRLRSEYYRAQMAGARLVMSSETEGGNAWAESQIKELTGNEAPVSARHPHGRPFTYRPLFKLQFVGNHAPTLKGRSPAMERRLRVIPFNHKPAKQDSNLKDRLREERPAILRWIIDGAMEWFRTGLRTATAIQQASETYFERQDTFGRWLDERCIWGETLTTRPGNLFTDYQSWCAASGESAMTSPEFAEKRGRTEGLIQKTIDGVRWIRGVGLRPKQGDEWRR